MRTRGFTLIEILVTIAILLALVSIVTVGMGHARETARVVATNTFMTSVSTAIDSFKRDHEFLPPSHIPTTATSSPMKATSSTDWRGAEILTQALYGYLADPSTGTELDEAAGPGAKKLRSGSWDYATAGRKMGPYIEAKDDTLVEIQKNWKTATPTSYDPKRFAFNTHVSRYNAPLLYIRKELGTVVTAGQEPPLWDADITSKQGQYRIDHNANSGSDDQFDVNAELVDGHKYRPDAIFEYWDAAPPVGPTAADKQAFETTLRSAGYVLVSAGPNDQFGIGGDDENATTTEDNVEYDDIIVTGR